MHNPYQTGVATPEPYSSPGYVSPVTYQALAGTRPWVKLCSVMGFIGAGFIILAGIVMLITGAVIGSKNSAVGAVPAFMGVFYIVVSIFALFPAIKLWKYGSSIVRLMSSRSTADLDQAMIEQKGYWQFVGILLLIGLCLFAVSVVLAMFGAASAGSRY